MRKLMTLVAIAAATFPGIAAAAEPACLTAAETTALARYTLPSAITGTAARCAATLPADAYLKRNATQLAARYSAAKAAAWPLAKSAALKIGGNDQAMKLFRTMPDANLQPIIDELLTGLVSQEVPLDRCSTIDRLVSLLSPLPAESTGEIIAVALGLVAKGEKRDLGRLSLCKE